MGFGFVQGSLSGVIGVEGSHVNEFDVPAQCCARLQPTFCETASCELDFIALVKLESAPSARVDVMTTRDASTVANFV
jgi:hypothetical protein